MQILIPTIRVYPSLNGVGWASFEVRRSSRCDMLPKVPMPLVIPSLLFLNEFSCSLPTIPTHIPPHPISCHPAPRNPALPAPPDTRSHRPHPTHLATPQPTAPNPNSKSYESAPRRKLVHLSNSRAGSWFGSCPIIEQLW